MTGTDMMQKISQGFYTFPDGGLNEIFTYK